MSYFLRNTQDDSLSRIINNLLPSKTKSMDFLVGYFYFSGLEEIYKNIEDKPMRILVGMDMDHDIVKKTAEFNMHTSTRIPSAKDIRDQFFHSLTQLFNETGYFESTKQAEAFEIYYKKIKEGTLEIRKTLEPSHAKMYIFDYKDELTENGQTPGSVITGSSNFTYSGFQSNNEINVRFHAKPEYDDAKEIFEELWADATVIVDKDRVEDFENGVLKHIWYEQTPTPYLLYLRVLYEYFHIDTTRPILTPNEITGGTFFNLKYQEDAVRLGIETIRKHNGAIIADVVGLGKSIIGATVARNLDLRTLIIAPPHLVKQWEDYSIAFGVRGTMVRSRGNMKQILEDYRQMHNSGEEWLVVVDEAHGFRNEYIKDYAILHELCQGNKVLLLTATPFNNRPEDIYAMIKLFQIPSRSTLQTVSNLGAEFAHWIEVYKELRSKQRKRTIPESEAKIAIDRIGQHIRKMIEPLVIRRSRIDLEMIPAYKEDLKRQGIEFPKVLPPEEKKYDLGDLTGLYKYTLERICSREKINPKSYIDADVESDDNILETDVKVESAMEYEEGEESPKMFVAARYQPLSYYKRDPENYKKIVKIIKDAGLDENLFFNSQRNLASFMRTLLVRRFESSQYAFKKSLDSMLSNCQIIKQWVDKLKCVPIYKKGNIPDVSEMYESTDDGIISSTMGDMIKELTKKGMITIPCEYLQDKFYEDLQSDIDILTDLKERWAKVPEDNDPKLSTFIQILREQAQSEPNRKIVAFSQFADTVEYLGRKLEEAHLPVFAYTSAKANKSNKQTIAANFDAGLKPEAQENKYHILIATDAISEGYNLHRAGTIFNYDIPYNPTRVIQRVGRINRINKKVFDELYIYNYFPTEIGEKETRTKQISTTKMAMIHSIMGEDTHYLTTDAELNNYFVETYQKLLASTEHESWDTLYRTILDGVIGTEDMKRALEIPKRSKIRRQTTFGESGVLVVAKRNDDFIFKFKAIDASDKVQTLEPKQAFEILSALQPEPAHKLSSTFYTHYDTILQDLAARSTKEDNQKSRREALQKVHILQQEHRLDNEYLQDLEAAIRYDAMSGYYLREINRIKPADIASLPDIISHEHILDILRHYNAISLGHESVIVAEEIQNITIHPQTEISL
ncbi:MAG: helicase [Paludibacteraceae bacterium]|nr:helicase [Paludibacteraceae bacterium]